MATLGIESNGRLEKTAIYFNGEQIGGLKELFLNLDENGTFDAILQYEGSDKVLYTRSVFTEYLTNVKIVEPSFTEEDAQQLQLVEIESDGNIENSIVFYNGEEQFGLISVFIHIKGAGVQKSAGIKGLFGGKTVQTAEAEFKAEFTFRNDDGSTETEEIF